MYPIFPMGVPNTAATAKAYETTEKKHAAQVQARTVSPEARTQAWPEPQTSCHRCGVIGHAEPACPWPKCPKCQLAILPGDEVHTTTLLGARLTICSDCATSSPPAERTTPATQPAGTPSDGGGSQRTSATRLAEEAATVHPPTAEPPAAVSQFSPSGLSSRQPPVALSALAGLIDRVLRRLVPIDWRLR